jgi:protein-tyrosine phosphatase
VFENTAPDGSALDDTQGDDGVHPGSSRVGAGATRHVDTGMDGVDPSARKTPDGALPQVGAGVGVTRQVGAGAGDMVPQVSVGVDDLDVLTVEDAVPDRTVATRTRAPRASAADADTLQVIRRPPALPPFRVVVVSSADISRGPAVQRILKTRLRSLGADAALVLSSAGTAAAGGAPIHPYTARALSELGTDPHGHQAHRLTERRLVQADLILAVAREQRSGAAQLRPGVRERTFTVVEFARLAAAAAPADPFGERRDPRQLVAELAGLRDSIRPVDPAEDDLEDPTAGTYRDHERVLRRVDHAVRDIARGLSASFPLSPENGG